MGLWNLFERRGSPPDLTNPVGWNGEVFRDIGAKTHSGKTVSQRGSLSFPAVFYCVSLIADSISTLPVDSFLSGKVTNRSISNPAWLVSPNPYMTRYDFWHRVAVSLLMDGNAFIATVRDESGSVVALYPLNPRSVVIVQTQDGRDVVFQHNGKEYDRSQILWIPAFTIPGEPRGLSPLEIARQAIGLGLTAEEYGARFFGQGASMTGIIQHPGNPTKDQALMLRDMFRRNHSGMANSHSLGILTGGATWQSVSITPEQSQFLETRRFQKSEIALIYRVPANQVDPTVTSSWGSGVEEQNKWFIDQTLAPWLTRIEQAISTFLLPGNRYIKFNLNARLRAKTAERYQGYAIGIQNGFMNADMIANLEDWEPIPDGLGAQYYRPANLTPITAETINPVPPAPAAPPPVNDNTGQEEIPNVNAPGKGDPNQPE
ncbi:phage portal protein [Kitasatospora sp. MBT66]|uniref:phage portal protein n=1 Tax=Kitasatospora sp. MBT66 TaxID=1444769 RepID=UPI0009E98A51|nr:phage portal protein [Kitasatospora sp. MBT66]